MTAATEPGLGWDSSIIASGHFVHLTVRLRDGDCVADVAAAVAGHLGAGEAIERLLKLKLIVPADLPAADREQIREAAAEALRERLGGRGQPARVVLKEVPALPAGIATEAEVIIRTLPNLPRPAVG